MIGERLPLNESSLAECLLGGAGDLGIHQLRGDTGSEAARRPAVPSALVYGHLGQEYDAEGLRDFRGRGVQYLHRLHQPVQQKTTGGRAWLTCFAT